MCASGLTAGRARTADDYPCFDASYSSLVPVCGSSTSSASRTSTARVHLGGLGRKQHGDARRRLRSGADPVRHAHDPRQGPVPAGRLRGGHAELRVRVRRPDGRKLYRPAAGGAVLSHLHGRQARRRRLVRRARTEGAGQGLRLELAGPNYAGTIKYFGGTADLEYGTPYACRNRTPAPRPTSSTRRFTGTERDPAETAAEPSGGPLRAVLHRASCVRSPG